jgi:archaellum component FlaG (FlaF/FlaG flagellin family)
MEISVKLLEYEVMFYSVDTPKYIETGVNSITFVNFGTSVVSVETVQLQPGQQFEVTGNNAEITYQRFFVNFSTGVGLVNNCVVVLKRYKNVS